VLRRRVWSRNIKNGCSIYIYDISRLRVNSAVLGYVSTGEAANISLWSFLGTLIFVWL